MSETFFPINDLLRRKLQTSLVLISLASCVASTLFLLLFSEKIGFGISLTVEGRLTYGFSIVFSRFIIFGGLLIFVVGSVVVSFMIFVMMSQRVRDIGLMKAAGCPNDLIFGYFMTELLIITFVGCFLGMALGILADFASTSFLINLGIQISQKPINFLLVLLVFVLFFILAVIVGAKPVLDTTRVEPARAISPIYYFGLSRESRFRVVSKSGLTFRLAMRSLFRRKSATIRIVVCLTAVFILVTVAVAGGIIAEQTTRSWVEKAVGRDIILIAHRQMCTEYNLLLSKFCETREDSQLNYTDKRYSIPEDVLNRLVSISGVKDVSARLVLKAQVKEVRNYTFNPETGATIPVGDDRKGESLIVGVEPGKLLSKWFLEGKVLSEGQGFEAMVGDSLAQKIFSVPLMQSMRLFDNDFAVIGVCLDPINNGNVTYVPLKALQSITGIQKSNVVMVEIDPSVNRAEILNQIRANISSVNPEFEVCELNEILDKNVGFLGYIWSVVKFLPLFCLSSASLCLIGYVMLAIAEQRQEFGVLRALGAKPKTVVTIISEQSFIVLLSSYAVGVALGIIITLLILVPKPLVTSYNVLEIAGWLLIAFAAIFVFSLYPATRFAKKPILEIMT